MGMAVEGKPMNRETGVGRCQVSGQRAGTGSSRQGEVGEGGRGKHFPTPVAGLPYAGLHGAGGRLWPPTAFHH